MGSVEGGDYNAERESQIESEAEKRMIDLALDGLDHMQECCFCDAAETNKLQREKGIDPEMMSMVVTYPGSQPMFVRA